MMPILLATSNASKSCVRRTYAFFTPSGRTRVLTLAQAISYIFLTACEICCLFARTSQMKTRVLLSSIFFMADSVVSGYLIQSHTSASNPTVRTQGAAHTENIHSPGRVASALIGIWLSRRLCRFQVILQRYSIHNHASDMYISFLPM